LEVVNCDICELHGLVVLYRFCVEVSKNLIMTNVKIAEY
jgi:hypothetical protein